MEFSTTHRYMQPSSFQCKSTRTREEFLVEVVLPGGSITQVFRNCAPRCILVQGAVDRVKWSIQASENDIEMETVELRIPTEYDIEDLRFVEKFNKGRVLFSLPVRTN